MSGICTPITDMVYVTGDYGGIAIRFQPGERWEFQQDEVHRDRLVAHKNNRLAVSLTIQKFHEVFEIKERKE